MTPLLGMRLYYKGWHKVTHGIGTRATSYLHDVYILGTVPKEVIEKTMGLFF